MPPDSRGRPWQEERGLDTGLRRARTSRDAGLRKVSRLTGWIVAGTIALTGVLSEVAAQALPGHKRGAPSNTQPSRQSDRAAQPTPAPSTGQGDQGSAAPSLQPPEQAPAPSDAAGGAVSGGS